MAAWIEFKQIKDTGKTKVFNVQGASSGVLFGEIKWYSQWRRYCFFPEYPTLFDSDCLRQINEFIDKLMLERKA